MVPGLCCPSSWPTKSHPRLSSSCLLKGGAGGSSSLAGEATGMVVASEVLPLPSEAPGWRLRCAELARHRSGRPMVVLRSALARHWARRLKGQCLAVQCWAMLMRSPAAWCPVMPMPRRSKVASLAGVGPSRNLVLAPSSSCEKATWKAFRASLCDAAMVKRENLSYA